MTSLVPSTEDGQIGEASMSARSPAAGAPKPGRGRAKDPSTEEKIATVISAKRSFAETANVPLMESSRRGQRGVSAAKSAAVASRRELANVKGPSSAVKIAMARGRTCSPVMFTNAPLMEFGRNGKIGATAPRLAQVASPRGHASVTDHSTVAWTATVTASRRKIATRVPAPLMANGNRGVHGENAPVLAEVARKSAHANVKDPNTAATTVRATNSSSSRPAKRPNAPSMEFGVRGEIGESASPASRSPLARAPVLNSAARIARETARNLEIVKPCLTMITRLQRSGLNLRPR